MSVLADLSTGDFRATEFSGQEAWPLAIDELEPTFAPVRARIRCTGGFLRRESMLPGMEARDAPAQVSVASPDTSGLDQIRTKTAVEDWVLTAELCALLCFASNSASCRLTGIGLAGHEAAAVAAGGLVHYL